MKRLLAILLLLLTVPARADEGAVADALLRARELKLAESREWRALLHIARDVLFRERSSIDDDGFFLSPRGRTNPQAELDATIKAFVGKEEIEGEPVACLYPARYAFLQEKLHLPAEPTCTRYLGWREKMGPTAVSIVFSAYYLNNPASMYGHTFLKLSRAGYEASGPLLDYTVNYAATTNSRNGIMFAARGLLGGYRGRFSTEPYYVKIQQYNNMESRDLWEYRLNLTEVQIDRLIRHLWELGGASMSYWFFNKNCSYQLLPLLDVAGAPVELARNYRFRAIPLDTLRTVITAPDFVGERRLRPSHLRVMLTRRSLLTGPEISAAEALVLGKEDQAQNAIEGIPNERRALVLDSAYDYLRYRAGFYRQQPAAVQERERRILTLRRAVPPEHAAAAQLTYDLKGPEEGHDTGRFTLAVGSGRDRRFQEFGVRASIHDLEASPVGYIEGSQLEMFNIRLRHEAGPGLYLEEAKVFEIVSLSPRDRWVRKPSWTVRANVQTARDKEASPDKSLVTGLDGGSGLTLGLLPGNRLLVYVMAKMDAETGGVLEKGHRIGYAGQAGILLRQNAGARLHLNGTATSFFTGDTGHRVELKVVQSIDLRRNVEARLSASRVNHHQEAMASLNLYW